LENKTIRKGFKRYFDTANLNKLTGDSIVAGGITKPALFALLKADVLKGEVFPAVRVGAIDFYYMGGCLYRLKAASFLRNPDYEIAKYSKGTTGLAPYEKAKKQNENKFINVRGSATERRLLDRLYSHTFSSNRKSKVVVLDIEVCLNGNIGGRMKCDLVLLNTEKRQIMFVEGKIFSDRRVNSSSTPKVIEQVETYTKAIAEQYEAITEHYANHIKIINELFQTEYNPQVSLIPSAKLLVYLTPTPPLHHGQKSIKTINAELGENNVVWYKQGEEPYIDEIWEALCK